MYKTDKHILSLPQQLYHPLLSPVRDVAKISLHAHTIVLHLFSLSHSCMSVPNQYRPKWFFNLYLMSQKENERFAHTPAEVSPIRKFVSNG